MTGGILSRCCAAAASLVLAYLLLSGSVATGLKQLSVMRPPNVFDKAQGSMITIDVVPVSVLIVLASLAWWLYRRAHDRVYLLDFACYKPPKSLIVRTDHFMWSSRRFGKFSPDALDFQERIFKTNGLSQSTHFPPAMFMEPPVMSLANARGEAEMVLFGAVEEVLQRTGLHARNIDILVVNCSLFNPTPSLSAMVINRFKMRSDILSYNLAGMGCSAGVIAIGLAQRLLRTEHNSYALVLSTENITQNWYTGNERSMLIPNTLFRMGGAAVVLTNRASERPRAKYELRHVVRVHLGADDEAHKCVFQEEDKAGVVGVSLNRDLVKVASRALERNLTKLGPLVLPASEQARYAWDWLLRRIGSRKGKPYVPDFRKAFDHFCLHAGGRGVIEGLGKQLQLSNEKLEPSYSSLHWYGNTSSASLWYALSYIEAVQGLRKGDVIWQVGFGSGFKCNSMVWHALRSLQDTRHSAWSEITPEDRQGMWEHLKACSVKTSK